MNVYPDGEYYRSSGVVRLYNIRPCGRRHSLKLICEECVKNRHKARINRSKNPIIPDLRDWVISRDGGQCQRCGSTEDLTVDHIHPVILGGKTDPDNLQALCGPCNSSKGGRLYAENSEEGS